MIICHQKAQRRLIVMKEMDILYYIYVMEEIIKGQVINLKKW